METMLERVIIDDMQANQLGTWATDLFIGELPPDLSQAVWLVAAASPPPHLYLDTEEQVIDFWCRSDHTDAAKAKLRAIHNLYHRRANYLLGADWYIYFSHVTMPATDMDRDRESGKLFKLSILFECRNVTNVS